MDSKGKRLQCISELQQLASNPGNFPDAPGHLKGAFYRMCLAYLDGDVSLDQAKQVIKPLSLPAFQDVIADALWWCGYEADKSPGEKKRKYFDLVLAMMEGMIPQDLLLERLDFNTLEVVELVDPKTRKEYNRRATQRMYVLAKYNLMRESNEGYAKLLTHAAEVHTNGPVVQSEWLQLVQLLVGYFRLDPYRVHSLLQDVWEQDVTGQSATFLPALRQFPALTCSTVVGFKMGRRERSTSDNSPLETEAGQTDFNSFFQLVALLVTNGMMGLADVYQYLVGPEPEKLEAKGRLLHGLLRAKMYEPALELLALGAPWSFGNARDLPLLQELLAYCGSIVDQLYRTHCIGYSIFGRGRPPTSPPADLLEKLKSYGVGIMCHIGPHFAHNITLFTKLCRVLHHFLGTKDTEMEGFVKTIIASVILPSLTITSANPALNFEIWQVLSQYSYEQRFELYGPLRDQVWDGSLAEIRKAANDRIDQALQTITGPIDAKYIKRDSRLVGQVAHCHPMLFADRLVQYISKVKGDIPTSLLDLLVRLAQYLTPLALDILVFQILLRISELSSALSGKKTEDSIKVGEDTATLSNLAKFCGMLHRRHFGVLDVTVLLHFLQRRLRAGDSMDLVLLDNLIQNSLGTRLGQNDETKVSVADMQQFCGGIKLRAYTSSDFLFSRSTLLSTASQMSTKALLKTLLTNDLGRSLVLLLGQLRVQHFAIHDVDKVSMAAPLLPRYDLINDTFYNLIQFLGNADQLVGMGSGVKGAIIKELALCPMDQLIQSYGLDLTVAFAIARPTLPMRPLWQDTEITSAFGPGITRLLPTTVRQCSFTLKAYFLFWTMDLQDLLPCSDAYKTTIQDLQQEVTKDKSKLKDVCTRSSSSDGAVDGRKLATQLQLKDDALTAIGQEGQQEKVLFDEGQKRMLPLVDSMRNSPPTEAERCIWTIIQECLLPRCLLSSVDATYCARFIHFFLKLEIPFSTIRLLHNVLKFAPYWLMFVTVKEAHRIGRFMSMVALMMLNWRQDPKLFAEHCSKSIGFREDVSDASTQISYERYISIHLKTHEMLTQSFERCLEGGEWHQQRNCLVALKMLHPHFPLHRRNYTTVLAATAPLKAHVNESIKDLAREYSAMLSRQPYHEAIDTEDTPYAERAKRRSRADSPPSKYAAHPDDKGKPSLSRPRHKDTTTRR